MRPTNTRVLTDTPTPFVPKATIKIAGQGPLSGDFASYGVDIMRGAELAVEQLAGPLMELGYAIELATFDDQDDIEAAVAAAKEIASDPEILCGVGPFTSRISNQVREIYHVAGLAFISPSATAPRVTERGLLEVNRLTASYDREGTVAAQFAAAQGLERAFLISQPGNSADFSQAVADNFRIEAVRLGITIVGNIATETMENFGWLIDQVVEETADLVYFSTLKVDQAGTFFREARAAGYTGAFLGPSSMNTPALLDIAGPLLIDGGGMHYTDTALAPSCYPDAADFVLDFETHHGSSPGVFAPQAYDAAGMCMKAIEEASNVKGGEIPNRGDVANAIRAIQDYQGIMGVYSLDENGDPSLGRYFIFQVDSPDPAKWNQNRLVTTIEVAVPE